MRAWERWPEVVAADSPVAWVHRVAFNLATSRFRRRAVERRAYRRVAGADATAGPDLTAVVVRAAVTQLPERQRAALVLRYFADLSIDDSATAMDCAPGTVKALTNQAIASLRSRLHLFEEANHV